VSVSSRVSEARPGLIGTLIGTGSDFGEQVTSGLAIANRESVAEALGASAGTFLSFVTPTGCGTQDDAVYDINDADVAVGAIVSGSCSPKPARWTGLFSGEVLDVPSGATIAVGINAGGDICGNGVPVAGGPKAGWVLVDSKFTWITAPSGAFDLEVVDLTDDRTVAGHYALKNTANAPTALFVWNDGVFTTLTPPPEFKSFRAEHIAVVNGATTVLGSATLTSTQKRRFFLWEPGAAMRFLNDIIDAVPGGGLWTNARARVNGAGAIATTVHSDGIRRAVRLNRRAPVADLDCNGSVDGADLALVLGRWGACLQNDACTADLDVNGVVDAADLAIVLGEWGARTAR